MKHWLVTLFVATAIAALGHFTQWFGLTRPAIEKVRAEAKERSDATDAKAAITDAKVAANTTRIETSEQKTAALETVTQAQAKQIDAVNDRVTASVKEAADANRATSADVAKLAERVDANAQSLKDMKAHIASGGTKTAEEIQFERDLVNAMTIAAQLKVAFAEAVQSEGRAPTSNAQVGAPAPERYADGALTRLAIESGGVVAYFKTVNPNPNPRIKLVPSSFNGDVTGPIRWKCETNIPTAARMFATCELKPSL
jgi:predicted phage tail protein